MDIKLCKDELNKLFPIFKYINAKGTEDMRYLVYIEDTLRKICAEMNKDDNE